MTATRLALLLLGLEIGLGLYANASPSRQRGTPEACRREKSAGQSGVQLENIRGFWGNTHYLGRGMLHRWVEYFRIRVGDSFSRIGHVR